MNQAQTLANKIIAECTSLESAIEIALVAMHDNNSKCDITKDYHTFFFTDKSALRIGVDGMQVSNYLAI